MGLIFNEYVTLPQDTFDFFPQEAFKPFNVYHELDSCQQFQSEFINVLERNGLGKFDPRGRTENKAAEDKLFGFAPEARLNMFGAFPDPRDFRDSLFVNGEFACFFDVKCVHWKFQSAWVTVDDMTSKVKHNVHGCSDLGVLIFWKFFGDEHPTRAGDVEFWKILGRQDRSIWTPI